MSSYVQWKLDGRDLEDRLAIYEVIPKSKTKLHLKDAAQLLDLNIEYVLADNGRRSVQIAGSRDGSYIVGFPKDHFVEVSRDRDLVKVVSYFGSEWYLYEIDQMLYDRDISRRFEYLKLREIKLQRLVNNSRTHTNKYWEAKKNVKAK